MSKNTVSGSTKDLKRVLGRKDLMSIAIGATIGQGVFSLTGIVIGMTGRSVNLAFILSAFLVIIMSLPIIFIGGTVRMRGGQYTQAAMLIDKRFAGFYAVTMFGGNIGLAVFAISFSQYLIGIVPGAAPYARLIALIFMIVFYVFNLLGIQTAAKVQNLMVIFMSAALATFIVMGIGKIQPGYFQQPGWMTGGAIGFVTGVAYLQSATTGAYAAAQYGAEAKNPTKDVPFVLVAATLVVAVFYALVGTVAAGVLPLEQVANQPLTEVAKAIMPQWMVYFFVIAGAGFALSTTLNTSMGWVKKPLLQATEDGWFPAQLGAVSKKRSVPYVWLTILFVIAMLSILTGWNIDTLTSIMMVITNVNNVILSLAVIRLPKVVPELWEKSSVKASKPVLIVSCVLAALAASIQLVLLLMTLTPALMIGTVAFVLLCGGYVLWRGKYVHMVISYEES